MGAAGIAIGRGGVAMGPAGIGKGSSEATRTGLATATGAGAGTGGAGPTAAGAAVGPAMGAAEATRTGRAVGPGAGATAVTGAGTAAGGAVAAIGAGVADENMEPQNLEPNSELGLVAARSSPRRFRRHVGSAGAIDDMIDPHCRSRVCSPRRRIDHVGNRLLGASSDHVRQAHDKNQKTNDPHTR